VKVVDERIRPNRPTTIDGTELIDSSAKRMAVVAMLSPRTRHVYARKDSQRNGDQHRQHQDVDRVPEDGQDATEGRPLGSPG